MADTSLSQIKTSENDKFTKISNEHDHTILVNRLVKHFENEAFDQHTDHVDHDDVDADDDDDNHLELLSNKSGKLFVAIYSL